MLTNCKNHIFVALFELFSLEKDVPRVQILVGLVSGAQHKGNVWTASILAANAQMGEGNR